MNFVDIHKEATEAAKKAADEMLARFGGDRLMCGFAWVNVTGVKLSTKLGKEFAKCGFTKSYHGGIDLWNPSGSPVQNIDIKEAGAGAYAEVLRKHGFSAYPMSRLD
jgi:hypothetical protein